MGRPIASPVPARFNDANAVHYGVLMGGPKTIEWRGVGENSVGHLSIPRRELAEFTQILVGRRNETAEALEDSSARLHIDWETNPSRIISKSARDCVNDVFELYGMRGWVIPESLIGMPYEQAVQLFEKVLPANIANQPLAAVINYLSTPMEAGPEATLRDELLNGAFTAQGWLTEMVRAISGERELALSKGTGKRSFDEVDKEYFKEIGKILPEDAPAQATLSLGQEIAKALDSKKPAKNDDLSEMVKAVIEQNKVLTELVKKSQQPSKKTEAAKAVDNKGE